MKRGWVLLLLIFGACSTSKKPAATQANLPVCVEQMIKKFEAETKQNPPRSIYSYLYQGQTTYYVPAICCDQFSDLYDSNCNLLGHPDGGFTGKGDGKHTEFAAMRSEEKLIWKDSR